MASGVAVSSEAKNIFEEVKMSKKYRYIVYHIKDEGVIEVESIGDRDQTYSQFFDKLNGLKTECRYCVFDFPSKNTANESEKESAVSIDRLILMSWCPENAKIKQKMLYSSSYDALKKALVGVYKYIQACDFEEASEEAVEDSLRKGRK